MTEPPRIAVYPGSFDPLTNGHVDIIRRGARLFDRVIVAVLVNANKHPWLSPEERIAIVRETFGDESRIEAEAFDGLLVDFMVSRRARVIVKGLRNVADFDYELPMTRMNRHLAPDVETVFLMPDERFAYLSSRMLKEVASLGGSVEGLVPVPVLSRLARFPLAAGRRS
jgi:pantetheine-phosphate adenylyltransferase